MIISSATDADILASEYEATVRQEIDDLTGVLADAVCTLMRHEDFDDGFGSSGSIVQALNHVGTALDILTCMGGDRVTVKREGEEHEGVYYRNDGLIRVAYQGRSRESGVGHSSERKVAKRLLTKLVIEAALVPEAVQ